MNLLVRLFYVVFAAMRGARLQPLDESVLSFRVLPNDLDANLHMNNGRYLTLMDLGRLDLIVRLGLVAELRRRRWNPVVASLAVVKASFTGPDGRVVPQELVDATPYRIASPEIPEAIRRWEEAEDAILEQREPANPGG